MMKDKYTVLVVDDTLELLSMLANTLSGKGFTVVQADGGKTGYSMAILHKPDIILLDLHMFDIDGMEVCRRLKTDDLTRDIPVILMSGSNDSSLWAEGLHLGAADFITKPFNNTELLLRIQTQLTLSEMIRSIQEQSRRLRKAEENACENELKYRIVADNTYDMEIWRDPQGNYIYVSPSCLRITGYSVEDFHSNARLFETLIIPRDRPLYDAHLGNEVKEHSVRSVEFRITRSDGEVRWIHHICQPVFDNTGTYIGVRGSNRDITDSKNLQTEKANLEAQLHQAQKLEAIGQLASGIAHDFNNILGGISGYADLLKLKYRNDPETREYVGKIAASTGKASHLTRQLLTFARKAKVENRLFDVHASLTTTIELLERTIDKNITIIKKFSPVTPLLFSDQGLFESCMLNLGINARDAMPDGGTLTIATDVKDIGDQPDTEGKFNWKSGRYVVITVIDTGTGMDESVRQRVFEPFFTTKELGKGTGLGLASVYGFVKQNDGYITVGSTLGKGTCFALYFPVSHDEPMPELRANDEQIHRFYGSGSILIVDDDTDISETLFMQLEQVGYQPVLCSNGLEAIRYYREHYHEITAVILDIIMPEMNGFECLREMKLVNPQVKIIICSGYSGGESREIILNEGVVAFLEKPFEFKEVARYLQDALRTDSAATARPGPTFQGLPVPASEVE